MPSYLVIVDEIFYILKQRSSWSFLLWGPPWKVVHVSYKGADNRKCWINKLHLDLGLELIHHHKVSIIMRMLSILLRASIFNKRYRYRDHIVNTSNNVANKNTKAKKMSLVPTNLIISSIWLTSHKLNQYVLQHWHVLIYIWYSTT